MNYPNQYKKILELLKNGKEAVLVENLLPYFDSIKKEIDDNREFAQCSEEGDADVNRMNYEEAREVVSQSVKNIGFWEKGDEVYDSIDDCADLLMDLDEVQQLEELQPVSDVWWQYIFYYDHHFGEHIRNLEKQVEWFKEKE